MRSRKIFLIAGLIIVLIVAGFYLFLESRYSVPILMYHNIDTNGKNSSLSVSPENFKDQMEFLSRYNYNVISLSELCRAKAEGERLPHNTVVLTFDDGYADNYYSAWPVLKKYNFPATIFVIVNSIGEEGYLTYPQIREMVSSDIVEIGSHSLGGDYLPSKALAVLEQEIGQSKRTLDAQLNKEIEFFSYPIGGFIPEMQEMLKKYGYKAACTTNKGRTKTHLNNEIFALKRIKVKDSPNLFIFWAKISGHYNVFRSAKKPYGE
jgi:peptidoglycan/xylan/chitin deacetylase (PgdA/CDA1 family)